MGYVFISYSRRQMYFAESVALSIQKAGFEIWFDLQKLGPGVDWSTALNDGYNNCEKLVFVASKAALASPYVQVEWETALRNGCEVIVVLSEAVTLPESLRSCPVYDARTHFDRTIQSLIAYLKGEQTARHDAVPAPGRFPLPLRMPAAIWFTLLVMALPSLTAWITTALLPVGKNLYVYAIGFAIGLYMLIGPGFGAFRFWRHSIRYEQIKSSRWNLLWSQTATSLICCLLLLFYENSSRTDQVAGFLILALPLITFYWAFRFLGRSADILRWFPSGDADQQMRENIQSQYVQGVAQEESIKTTPPAAREVLVAVHSHPADRPLGEWIAFIVEKEGCTPTPQENANTHLVVLTNRTSKEWLNEMNNTLPGKVVYILGTNIDTSPELQPILQKQLVDFRTGNVKTIQALAARLIREESTQTAYGMQASPKGFESFYSVPFITWVVTWVLAIPAALLVLQGLKKFGPGSIFWILPGIALWFWFDLLMMRKAPLPGLIRKIAGRRLAWFASPAPSAKDAVGMDRKRRARLVRWALLPLVVFLLADMLQPPEPITVETTSMEISIDGTPSFLKVGDTLYQLKDGTRVPISVNGTPVGTPKP